MQYAVGISVRLCPNNILFTSPLSPAHQKKKKQKQNDANHVLQEN